MNGDYLALRPPGIYMRGHMFIPVGVSSGYLSDKLVHATEQCTPPSDTHVSMGQSTVGRAKDRVMKPAQVACWWRGRFGGCQTRSVR